MELPTTLEQMKHKIDLSPNFEDTLHSYLDSDDLLEYNCDNYLEIDNNDLRFILMMMKKLTLQISMVLIATLKLTIN